MICTTYFRPDAITRTGVIQPWPGGQTNPVDVARSVLGPFIQPAPTGDWGAPPPEEIARKAYDYVLWMRRGVRIPAEAPTGLLGIARMVNDGQAVAIRSQGRTVILSPDGRMISGEQQGGQVCVPVGPAPAAPTVMNVRADGNIGRIR